MIGLNGQLAFDDCFALMGEDDDFLDEIVETGKPTLSCHWAGNRDIARMSPAELLRIGRNALEQLGVIHIRTHGRRVQGETQNGQRVELIVVRCGGRSACLLISAGMPGTKQQTRAINRRWAKLLKNHVARAATKPTRSEAERSHSASAHTTGLGV